MYVVATYSSIGTWPVAQYRPCSTYVSSLVTPASRIAKSAAVEVGNVWARYSSNEPVNPGSPPHVGHDALARRDARVEQADARRSAVSSSTLTSMPGRLAVERCRR